MTDPVEPQHTNGAEHPEQPEQAEDRDHAASAARPAPRSASKPSTRQSERAHGAALRVAGTGRDGRGGYDGIRSQWQRTAADFANYKRRSEEDRVPRAAASPARACCARSWGSLTTSGVPSEHVPPDRQESGLGGGRGGHRTEGGGAAGGRGVSVIEAVGTPFDPRRHEAVTMEPSERGPRGHRHP